MKGKVMSEIVTKELLKEIREAHPGPIYEVIFDRVEHNINLGHKIVVTDPLGECIFEMFPAEGSC